MSNVIDQKVVEMRFDNKQFESGVRTSLSTLNNLKQGLNLTGASKGLESISAAAKNVNFSPISNGVDVVVSKFSHLQMSVQHQLDKIVDHAIASGKRIVDALTVDPIKMGFQEYETQINAVQTILANTESKGTTLNDVNLALDTLNKYADKTIYNFTEMTRNIGTFTAAGVDLDTSVNAIQGIANLAAISGSSSQQASTAMYQLSQALSSGTVKLMDWNSVVNAGMGGQVFQDALKETARVHGIAIDSMIEEQGSFRETLSEGWLTSEILTETLQKFTLTTEGLTEQQIEANRQMLKSKGYTEEQIEEIFKLGNTATNAATKVKTFTQLFDTLKEAAQSGWTQTWETIVGDFEESKELMTSISDAVGNFINATSESRNELLSGALDTNWEKLIKEINGAGIETDKFEEKAKAAMKAHGLDVDALIKEHGSLEEVFRSGAVSSDILKEAVDSLTGSLVDLSGIERELKVGVSGDDVKLAQEALKNLGYDLGSFGVDGKFGSVTEKAVKSFQELNGLEVTGIIDDKTLAALEKASESSAELSENCDNLIDKITELGGREKIIESLKNVFKYLGDVIKPIKEAFRDIFPKTEVAQVQGWIDSFHEFTKGLKLSGEQAKNIKSIFTGFFSAIDIGLTLIKELIGGAFRLLGNFTGLGGSVLEVAAAFGDWLTNLRNGIKDTDIFGKGIDAIVGFISGFIDKLKICKKSIDDAFDSPKFKGILGFFKGLWSIMELIGSKIAGVFSSITGGFIDTLGNPNLWNAVNSGLFAGILTGIARFTNKLPGMLDGIGDILENATGILDDVRGCFEAYQNQLKAGTLMKIASAIALLAGAILIVAMIPEDALDRSLGAITVLFGELIGSFAALGRIGGDVKGTIKAGMVMTSIAASVIVLSIALKILSSIKLREMAIGLTGMAVGLGVLVAAVNLLPEKNVMKASKAIKKLCTSLIIFAIALKIMATMSWEDIAKGLVATVGGLAALVAAVNLLPKDTGLKTLGMISLATSLVILGGALKIMGTMSWGEIGRGLTVLAGSLLAITLAMKFMPKSMPLIGAGLLGVAAALVIMGGALKIMGSMSWEEVGKGLVVMGGALLELAIALNLMRGTLSGSAALLVAAAALAIITPVIKSLGKMDISSIVKALGTLAITFAVIGAAAFILQPVIPALLGLAGALALLGIAMIGIGAGVVLISAGLAALATVGTVGATAIVAALTIIVTGVANLIPLVLEKLGEGIVQLCLLIGEYAPQLAEAFLTLLLETLKALATYAPQILDSLLELLIGLLRSLADHLPELIVVAVEVIGAFFQGIVDALNGMDTTTIFKGLIGAGLLAGLMFALSAVVGLIPGAMAGVIGMGVVIAELALVLAAIGALAQIPGLQWLIDEGGDLLQSVGTAIGKFVGGIVGGFMGGVSDSFPEIGKNLSDFIVNAQGFIDGCKNIDESVVIGAGCLAGAILAITVADLIAGITQFLPFVGKFSELGTDLSDFMLNAMPFVEGLNRIDENAVKAATSLVGMILALTAADLISGITSFLGGEVDFGKFGEEIVAFGEAIVKFSDEVAGNIDADAVTAAANAGSILAELQKSLYGEGGIKQDIFGEKDLEDFGDQIAAFGEAMADFSEEVDGKISEDAVKAAANAGSIMAKLQEQITPIGGVVGFFTGDQGLDTFGEQIVDFGEAITEFAEEVEGLDENDVKTAANAGLMMADLQAAIPEDKWLDGKMSLDDFGKTIVKFGEKMIEFSETCSSLSSDKIEVAATIASKLNSMLANFGSSNTDALSYFDDNDLTGFMDGLINIQLKANGLSEEPLNDFIDTANNFATSVSNFATIDTTGVTTFKNVIDELKSIDVSGLESFDVDVSGLDNLASTIIDTISTGMSTRAETIKNTLLSIMSSAADSLSVQSEIYEAKGSTLLGNIVLGFNSKQEAISSSVSNIISGIATSISNGGESFREVGAALIDDIIATFTSAVSEMGTVGENLMTSIVNGMNVNKGSLKTTVNGIADDMDSAMKSKNKLFQQSGTEIIKNLMKGIKSQTAGLLASLKTAISTSVVSLTSYYDDFYSTGSYLVDGFTSGISANSYKAAAQAAAMAKAAKQAAEEALGIASPSKVFYGIGDYSGQGFVNALADYAVKSYKAGSEMANSAREGLTNAISKATDVLNGKTDMQPTIRPVVDLSGVESGTSAINSMLSMGSRIGISANVGAVSSMMSRRNQNGVNSDIVAAIDRLDKHLDNVGGTSYSVNGITYDDGSNVKEAIETLVRAARIERRV